MSHTLLMAALLSLSLISYSQTEQTCTCKESLEGLIQKVQTVYAGYFHKVVEAKDSSLYSSLMKDLNRKADKTSFSECYWVMDEYLRFFKDRHLFVVELPELTKKQGDSLAANIPTYQLTGDFKSKLRKSTHDPIEGLWKDASQELAIVRVGKDKFLGIITKSTVTKWVPGMVRLELAKNQDQSYNILYRRDDFAPVRFSHFKISKELFFSFGLYRLTKIYPEEIGRDLINPHDPQLPIARALNDRTMLITLPSALVARRYVDSLFLANDSEIKKRENLIIDLRGNGGGNFIWSKPYEIANTKSYPDQKKPGEDDFLLLASESTAQYFGNFASFYKQSNDSVGVGYYENLASLIRSQMGRIIGFSFYEPAPDTAKRPIFAKPKRIAVLIDRTVGSAAEAFLLGLKNRSDKVVFYGENTVGMIDYMNISIIRFGCTNNQQYFLGYPTFFSKEIKTKQYNPTGIIPDVLIPRAEKDWLEFVLKDLGKKETE